MGLNNLSSVQALLAENIRGGLSGLGNRPLDEAQFGLNKAQLEHQMGREQAQDLRQSEMDKLQRPGFEVQSQVAQGQLDAANAPVRITDFMTDMNTAEHMMYTPQDNWEGAGKPQQVKDPAITRIASMYGAAWDTNPQSLTRGQMLKADGTPVTKLDLNRDAAPLKAFMVANTGMDHTTRSAEEKLLRAYQTKKITDAQYNEGLTKINKFKSSLPSQMKYAQSQIDFLSKFANNGNPLFQGEIADGLKRWQAKYDKLTERLQGKIDKADDQTFEKFKMKYDRETKYGVEKIKNEGKTKADKEEEKRRAVQHVVGWGQEHGFDIRYDEDGGLFGNMTEAEINWLKPFAKQEGLTLYKGLPTGDERDRKGLFTGDDQLYGVTLASGAGVKDSVGSFIDQQLSRYPDVNKPEVAKPKLQAAHGQVVPNLESAHTAGQGIVEKRALSPEEAIARAEKLRGKSTPIKIRMGKRKPGTPRP